MKKYFAVKGRTPGGRAFRGIIATDGQGLTVLHGPPALTHRPWDKRVLTIPELEDFASVLPCTRPRLMASIKSNLEHKFAKEQAPKRIASRGRFLSFIQELLFKLSD